MNLTPFCVVLNCQARLKYSISILSRFISTIRRSFPFISFKILLPPRLLSVLPYSTTLGYSISTALIIRLMTIFTSFWHQQSAKSACYFTRFGVELHYFDVCDTKTFYCNNSYSSSHAEKYLIGYMFNIPSYFNISPRTWFSNYLCNIRLQFQCASTFLSMKYCQHLNSLA